MTMSLSSSNAAWKLVQLLAGLTLVAFVVSVLSPADADGGRTQSSSSWSSSFLPSLFSRRIVTGNDATTLHVVPSTETTTAASQSHRRLASMDGGSGLADTTLDILVVADTTAPAHAKFVQDLQHDAAAFGAATLRMVSTMADQERFLAQHCPDAQARFADLVRLQQGPLATELYKYCALSTVLLERTSQEENNNNNGGAKAIWIDTAAVDSLRLRLQDIFQIVFAAQAHSVAVLGETSHGSSTIHGSFLVLDDQSRGVATGMMQQMIQMPLERMLANPLSVSETIFDLIESQVRSVEDEALRAGVNANGWFLLNLQCYLGDTAGSSSSTTSPQPAAATCPMDSHCCRVILDHQADTTTTTTLFWTTHIVLPAPARPSASSLQPFNPDGGHYREEELPYITTIRQQVMEKPPGKMPVSKNMFDILVANQCLPDSKECARCLHSKSGANCDSCAKQCSCYCKTLCKEHPEPKFVAKKLTAYPPVLKRNPNRLVPRIIHQTYFEELDPEKYPNMSRLVESFKQSGWDYRFYSDEEAQDFLSTHFPPEVRQAYDALRPGAFKADLFRYCALFITGGVYADVDILLESNLDVSVAPDVGFMVPVDEPGMEAGMAMCVWNGFIASAPAHPFLANAIETVVNQIRNRYTSVDYVATFCPNPELSVLFAFDTLFTAGPCALGSAINRVMGRKGQTPFVSGELIAPDKKALDKATSFVLQPDGEDAQSRIPGRTILLHQDKWDMGAHRFTFKEQSNLIVAATDLPDSDDREATSSATTNTGDATSGGAAETTTTEGGGEAVDPDKPSPEHYSSTHASVGIYGLHLLYNDDLKRANEDLKWFISHDMTSRFENDASSAA